MQTNELISKNCTYFAAANGYNGFRSYYEETFDSGIMTKKYILKGGPGTGKSTLMKSCADALENLVEKTDIILCSSDINSLDGVIFTKGEKKVCIIDGTAPHECDTRIAGACDRIINLGDFWSDIELVKSRAQIEELNKRKKRLYQKAYEFLEFAGDAWWRLYSYTNKAYRGDRELLLSILSKIEDITQGRNANKILISSFSKTGFARISPLNFNVKRTVFISGVYGSEYKFIEETERMLDRNEIQYTKIVSPYSEKITEGVLIPDNLLILADNSQNCEIDTSLLLDKSIMPPEDILDFFSTTHTTALKYARKSFAAAADSHFALEKIYSSCMDFGAIRKNTENLISEISKILLS